MATEQMQIKIGADVTAAVSGLKNVASAQNEVSASAGKMAKSVAVAGSALPKVAKSSDQATQSLGNLSRIVQDAPYGFIGIANNINPAIESFQRLRASAGTTGGALKALGSSLIGAGGLGLAVGLASSLLVVFGDKLFASGNAAKEQANKLKEAREALNDYVDSLNDVEQARVKGLQSAQQELVHLKTLYEASQNVNIPLANRKKIVDELQEQYPKYFGSIKDEVILLGGAETAYKNLTAAIIANAKSRAAEKQIEDLASQGIALDQKRNENSAKQIKLQQQLNALKAKGVTEISATGEERLTKAGAQANVIQQQLNSTLKEGNEILKQRTDITTRQEQLSKFVKVETEKKDFDFDPGGKNAVKKVKDNTKDLEEALKARKAILEEFQRDFETLKLPLPELSMRLEDFSIEGLIGELRDKLTTALTTTAPIKIKLPKIALEGNIEGIDEKKIPIQLKPTLVWQDTDLHKQLEDFGQVGNAIGERLGHGFGEVFEKIFEQSMTDAVMKGMTGEALENFKRGLAAVAVITSDAFNGVGDAFGNLTSALFRGEDAMKAFGDSLKNTFAQLAAQLVKTIALAAVLSLLTGGVGAKGGLSFLGAFKKILGFAEGGTVPGGVGTRDTVPAMLTPGEEVLTTKEAPIWRMFKKMFSITTPFKMPKMSGGVFHFNQGGTVPNIDRQSPLNNVKNNITVQRTEFPAYLPAFSMSHDQFRLWYKRADTYGNKFGR